jgi:uncharacterized membrane protein HdeD (DUF308 family)
MVSVLARNWGMVLVRGVVALLFGLLTFFRPGISLAALVILFGAYALVDGLIAVWSALANRHEEPRWGALLFGGLAAIAVGVVTFLMPGITALALLYLIGAWAIVRGVAEIAMAIQLRKVLTGEWLLALAGVVSVAFGLFLFASPRTGALAVVLWIGFWAAVLGVILIALAFRLRKWNRAVEAEQPRQARAA